MVERHLGKVEVLGSSPSGSFGGITTLGAEYRESGVEKVESREKPEPPLFFYFPLSPLSSLGIPPLVPWCRYFDDGGGFDNRRIGLRTGVHNGKGRI